MKRLSTFVIPLLAACGRSETVANEPEPVAAVPTFTCAELVNSVIRLAAENQTKIVKVYGPKRIGGSDVEPSCKGDALLSSGATKYPIYFKRVIDEEGDALVQYSGEPFTKDGA